MSWFNHFAEFPSTGDTCHAMGICVDISAVVVVQSGSDSIPLGSIQMSNFSCGYKSAGPKNMEVSVAIPSIEVIDLRPDAPVINATVLSSRRYEGNGTVSFPS